MGGEDTEGRSVEGLGEGVRLGFRNADFSGVFIGRGLSIGGEEASSPLYPPLQKSVPPPLNSTAVTTSSPADLRVWVPENKSALAYLVMYVKRPCIFTKDW